MVLKISEMSGKLKGIPAINTNTLTNPWCVAHEQDICGICYSKRMLKTFRRQCVNAYEDNSRILSIDRLHPIPRFNSAWVRLHSHGELINRTHYENFMLIAEHNPQTRFVLWTKRPELCYGNHPKNLILIFSISKINGEPFIPRNFDGCFIPVEVGETCKRRCIECLHCYTSERPFYVFGNIH